MNIRIKTKSGDGIVSTLPPLAMDGTNSTMRMWHTFTYNDGISLSRTVAASSLEEAGRNHLAACAELVASQKRAAENELRLSADYVYKEPDMADKNGFEDDDFDEYSHEYMSP